MPSVGSINGWISRRKSCCKREFKDRTPAFMRRGRKYFNTDACNIKGAKAVCTAIIRVLDERAGEDASEGAYTRVYTRARPEDLCCLSSRTKGADVYGRTRNHLLWHRFPRVWRAFLPFGFNDSFAAPGPRARPTPVAALISRNGKNDERLADAFSANERRSDATQRDVSRFFARVKIRLYGIIRRTGRLYFFFLDS